MRHLVKIRHWDRSLSADCQSILAEVIDCPCQPQKNSTDFEKSVEFFLSIWIMGEILGYYSVGATIGRLHILLKQNMLP